MLNLEGAGTDFYQLLELVMWAWAFEDVEMLTWLRRAYAILGPSGLRHFQVGCCHYRSLIEGLYT